MCHDRKTGFVIGVCGALILSGCTHLGLKPNRAENSKLTIHFQNMVALEISPAGCSVLHYGGLERLCDYQSNTPSDLMFQIGPGLSRLMANTDPIDAAHTAHRRSLLWREWARQGVRFYTVDARDLEPSLEALEALAKDTAIVRLSTNIKTKDGTRHLFEPYYTVAWGKKQIVFLGFSEPAVTTHDNWQVTDIGAAFTQMAQRLESQTDLLVVTGSLSPATRARLATLSTRPLLFLGGELSEPNTLQLQSLSPTAAFAKAPDLGRGIGAIELSESPATGSAIRLGDLTGDFRPTVFRKSTIQSPRCQELARTISDTLGGPNSCSAIEDLSDCPKDCGSELCHRIALPSPDRFR